MITLAQINAMTVEQFTAAFGDVAEHSPWVATHAAAIRPYVNRAALIAGFAAALRAASQTEQLAVIRAHPDLATKAKLTDDSNREQQGAGLGSLTTEEFNRFTVLNTAYKSRFGFPFIFAVKGATKHDILASFENRISNSPEAEFAMAITQVLRIFQFRLEDRATS